MLSLSHTTLFPLPFLLLGDSVTVAPAQTLTDKEYQRLRDAAVAIIREMGVECGGSNVQMSINPDDGDMIIIEMNPRVSRWDKEKCGVGEEKDGKWVWAGVGRLEQRPG